MAIHYPEVNMQLELTADQLPYHPLSQRLAGQYYLQKKS